MKGSSSPVFDGRMEVRTYGILKRFAPFKNPYLHVGLLHHSLNRSFSRVLVVSPELDQGVLVSPHPTYVNVCMKCLL